MATSDELAAQRLRDLNESKRQLAAFNARIDQANIARNKVSEEARAFLDQIKADTSLTEAQRAQAELDFRNNTLAPANTTALDAYEQILQDAQKSGLIGNDISTLLERTQKNISTLAEKVGNNSRRIQELTTQLGTANTSADRQREKTTADGQTAGDSQPANQGSDGTGTNAGNSQTAEPVTAEEKRNLSNPEENESQAETRRLRRQRDDAAEPAKEKTQVKATQSVDRSGTTSTNLSSVTQNILHNYATYTYGITLHLLTPDSYNKLARGESWLPDAKTLISSAGRWGQNPNDPLKFVRPSVFADDFYFDGFNLTSIIGMSAQGKASNVVDIAFTLIEPYGLTLLNRLLDMANELDIPNYLCNPYVIQIDFFGNDEAGQPVHPIPNTTKYIPVKIIEMKIKVGTSGATYACRAIPYNHVALSQNVASTPVNFEITARTVRDFFQNDSDENNLSVRAEKDKQRKEEIAKLQDKINNPAPLSGQSQSRRGRQFQQQQATASRTSQAIIDAKKNAMTKPYEVNSYNGAYNAYQKFLVESNSVKHPTKIIFEIDSEIAESEIVYAKKNSTQTGPMNNNEDPKSINKSVSANKRGGNATAGPQFNQERFNVNAGASVMDVINLVLRSSTYVTDQLKDNQQTDKDGNPVNWFKVVPQLQIKNFDSKINDYSYEVTYKIIKYAYHNGKHPDVSKSSQEQLERNLRKQYDYIYTGKNMDIIDFAIDFDALFFTAVNVGTKKQETLSDSQDAEYTVEVVEGPSSTTAGAGRGTAADPRRLDQPGAGAGRGTSADPRRFDSVPAQVTNTEHPNQYKVVSVDLAAGGFNSGQNAKVQRAADVAKSIYSSARGDMINLTLKIIGDPDFIKQDDIYYSPGNANYLDNNSLETDRGDIFARVTFKTPVDIDTYTGGLRTDEKYVNSNFSGIYQIIKVASELRGGRFEQTLNMIRHPNANVDPATANSKKQRNNAEASTIPGQDALNTGTTTKATDAASLRAAQNQLSGSETAPEQSYNQVESAKTQNAGNTENTADTNDPSLSKLEQTAVSGETRSVNEVQATSSTAKDSTADNTASAPPAPAPDPTPNKEQQIKELEAKRKSILSNINAKEKALSEVNQQSLEINKQIRAARAAGDLNLSASLEQQYKKLEAQSLDLQEMIRVRSQQVNDIQGLINQLTGNNT